MNLANRFKTAMSRLTDSFNFEIVLYLVGDSVLFYLHVPFTIGGVLVALALGQFVLCSLINLIVFVQRLGVLEEAAVADGQPTQEIH